MKTKILFLLLTFTVTVNSFGQNSYYFKPWKTKSIILIEKIYIIVNTIQSEEEKNFFEVITNSINRELQNQEFSCELINQNILDSINIEKDLVLSFEFLKLAYVQLNTFGGVRLCNRFEIKQIYPMDKTLIKTAVSISVINEYEGIFQFAKEFTDRLLKYITKKKE